MRRSWPNRFPNNRKNLKKMRFFGQNPMKNAHCRKIGGNEMRRGVGIGAIQKKKAAAEKFRNAGKELEQTQLSHVLKKIHLPPEFLYL